MDGASSAQMAHGVRRYLEVLLASVTVSFGRAYLTANTLHTSGTPHSPPGGSRVMEQRAAFLGYGLSTEN